MSVRVKKNYLVFRGKKYKSVIGANGLTRNKVEGDLSTPCGSFKIESIMYRDDKVKGLTSSLPLYKIRKNDGWCDDVNHPSYNKRIQFPFAYSAEQLYREDSLYDMVCVLNYNTSNIVKGKGSAIFLHVASTELDPTAGCIAMVKGDLYFLIKNIRLEENRFNID